MEDNEEAIRALLRTWHEATAAGDVARILPLMAEDVVFLGAGRAPMHGRRAFEEGLRTLLTHSRIDSRGEVREIVVSGDFAYCWSELSVKVAPMGGGAVTHLAGPALSILRKRRGAWTIVRDANMLAPLAARMP
ncbi:MAG TPA: SgcJ/EcaC family oxidoreductase [Casimicrobiaceae bacterium]|nr:SgcJ/EcaC family oxidoreductase [Casimicrobiaceae bacterium]